MTDQPMLDKERLREVLRSFHRDSCYPQAMPHEIDKCAAEIAALFEQSPAERLLPCPFCGSDAEISYGRDGEICNVRCIQWGASVCLGAGKNCGTEDEAIAAWNTRSVNQNAAHTPAHARNSIQAPEVKG